MEINKKYTSSNRTDGLLYTCVAMHPESGKPILAYPKKIGRHEAGCFVEIDQFLYLYKEYKEPKKVYCSVWRQGSNGYQWTTAHLDSVDYNKMKDYYLRSGYIMIKEWELEYEPS